MKQIFRLFQLFLLAGLLATPCHADSRSATIKISCTITPMIGLSSDEAVCLKDAQLGWKREKGRYGIFSNLEKNYTLRHDEHRLNHHKTRILTLTAK